MGRGDKPITLIKHVQIKRYFNTRKYQITKEANYTIARHLEHHIEAILREITKTSPEAIRIKETQVYKALESLYGNDRGDSK